MTRPRDPDARMLRRAAVTVAVQTAVAVAIVVAAVGGITWLLTGHHQSEDARHQLERAVRTADDVGDPPGRVTLVAHLPDGRTDISPGAPDDLRRAAYRAVPDGFSTIRAGHARYLVYAGHGTEGHRVVGYLDQRERHDESERLLGSLAAAGVVGVVAAAAVGGFVGYRAVRPLGRALSIQRRFVADASHELRTPLTVMHTRTQMMRRHLARGGGGGGGRARDGGTGGDSGAVPRDGGGDPAGDGGGEPGRGGPDLERLAADLDRLAHDARNLSDVVDDLLLSAELRARPEAGEIVDVADLADDTVEAFQPVAGEREVTLRADLPRRGAAGADLPRPGSAGADFLRRGSAGADLPRPGSSGADLPGFGAAGALVRGVPSALRRALSSLLDNALTHVEAGGHVTVTVRRTDGSVIVEVTDDGPGLDPAETRHLLERFARGPSGPGRSRRFGLGLSLVREVVHTHAGSLTITGTPGNGATFTIHLPEATT